MGPAASNDINGLKPCYLPTAVHGILKLSSVSSSNDSLEAHVSCNQEASMRFIGTFQPAIYTEGHSAQFLADYLLLK